MPLSLSSGCADVTSAQQPRPLVKEWLTGPPVVALANVCRQAPRRGPTAHRAHDSAPRPRTHRLMRRGAAAFTYPHPLTRMMARSLQARPTAHVSRPPGAGPPPGSRNSLGSGSGHCLATDQPGRARMSAGALLLRRRLWRRGGFLLRLLLLRLGRVLRTLVAHRIVLSQDLHRCIDINASAPNP